MTVRNSAAAFVAVYLGAPPLVVAAPFFALYDVGALAFFQIEVRARRREWMAAPALPTRAEFAATFHHVKRFASQMIAPTVWSQTPACSRFSASRLAPC